MSEPALEPDLFERFGLSPTSDGASITDALRERAEDAAEGERPAIRAAWEALTRHAEARLELALDALPLPEPLGPPPPAPADVGPLGIGLDDLASFPPLGRHLTAPSAAEDALDRPRTEPVVGAARP